MTQDLIGSMKFETDWDPTTKKLSVTLTVPSDGTKRPIRAVKLVRPNKDVFQAQIPLVFAYAELREERMAEILSQIDNQNCFWGAIVPFQADRLRHTRELVEAATAFFAALRRLDALRLDRIYATPFPPHGLGRALNDRLTRAAH